jgi:hypothetical protein
VAIVGRTGSGKSVALRSLLRGFSRAVLLDPKGRASMDGWPVVYGVAAFVRAWPSTSPRIVVRVGPGEDRREWLDKCCWHIYRHGETGVGVDEVVGIVDANRRSPGFDAVQTQGRELGITCLTCTQRPRGVPPTILSEADHVMVFALNRADDRAAVAETTGPYPEPRSGTFCYAYWSPALDRPIECAPIHRTGSGAPATPDAGDAQP